VFIASSFILSNSFDLKTSKQKVESQILVDIRSVNLLS